MKIYYYEVQIEDVLKEILKVADYAWTRENVPLVMSIQSIRDHARKEIYLEERDMWKRDREGNEKYIWRKTSIEHGGTICRAKSIKQKIQATKILYDWEDNGRNRAKKEKDSYYAEIAGRCRECGIPDSQFHIITECITAKLTGIRIETEARIDLYIQDVENKEANSEIHHKIKSMVNSSLRPEKLRLGLWEHRDIDELSELETIKNATESEINQIRSEIENLNKIYYNGCKELIREKKKMDWEDRNPNYKADRKSNSYRKEYGCKKKTIKCKKNEMNVNEVLKTHRHMKRKGVCGTEKNKKKRKKKKYYS
jgi:hypothetical protein